MASRTLEITDFNVTAQNATQVEQGANLNYIAENMRIQTATAPGKDTANIPKENSENKRIKADGTANAPAE